MTNKNKHWQNLARETRALAGTMADPEVQRSVLEIASSSDRPAALAENRELGQSPRAKSDS